ncbi:uncharacterized protein MCYG_05255 [Microsporum canis CBS 113480]|uniref:Uncharacterized protein n=1 Tax=Arthroderma otae (strain ATCC MYA-4605 / CBS 113480) TaxID=554155 RepID=C5FRD3_ARTOC|nr:uncharacterized protein MCYG_05255 [Microsporum canis CBS 113480]EEQ32436.1 predicted protein [Microsporum canis CBS 113480]
MPLCFDCWFDNHDESFNSPHVAIIYGSTDHTEYTDYKYKTHINNILYIIYAYENSCYLNTRGTRVVFWISSNSNSPLPTSHNGLPALMRHIKGVKLVKTDCHLYKGKYQ